MQYHQGVPFTPRQAAQFSGKRPMHYSLIIR
jgi:hypothetical protein